MATYIYDSDRVMFVFAGIPITGGYTDGDFISITVPDAFTMKVGTSGEVSRSKTRNRTATIELHLMSTSPFNAVLSGIHNADLETSGGAGVGEFNVTDLNGTSTHVAGNAWIVKAPDVTYGAEAVELVWTFNADRLTNFVGGTR